LRHESDVALAGHTFRETHVKILAGRDIAQAVGPHDPHAVIALAEISHLSFQSGTFCPHFFETGRYDDDAVDAPLSTLAHIFRHGLRSGTDDSQIGQFGQGGQIGIGLNP